MGIALRADMELILDNPTRDEVCEEYDVVIILTCKGGVVQLSRGRLLSLVRLAEAKQKLGAVKAMRRVW